MSGWSVGILVLGVVLFDVFLVMFLVRAGWGMVARKEFPAVSPAADAVRRDFQSISVNSFNFGYCVHVAADERCLHLLPAKFIRWAGGRPVSIPWEAIEVQKPGKRLTRARIGRDTFYGPAWAMELAASNAQ